MNVLEIKTSVQRQFGDESGVQVTDADILRWINQGMRQIVMQNESLLLTDAFANSVAGQQQYTLPSDLLLLRSIHYKDTSSNRYHNIKGYDLPKFNAEIDGWDGDTANPGFPQLYSVIDTVSNIYAVWPIPDVSVSQGFKVYYNRIPTSVAVDNDVPELPILYHELIVKHCMLQAYKMDEDWDAAGNEASELDRDINLLRGREDWKVQETYPVINVRWEDM